MIRIVESSFAASASAEENMPDMTLAEVAFAGRSNVGKSSLMNSIMERKGLVRVSSTPGCTRNINFFRARLSTGPELYFVDLPGYGYAKISKQEQLRWKPLVEEYLSGRGTLRMVVLIVDIRRGMEKEEEDLAEFVLHHGKKLLVVATKTDRVKSSKTLSLLKAVKAPFPDMKVIGFSAKTGRGTEDILREISLA